MNKNILIIDADTELTDVIAQYLKHEGFETTAVPDGISGVKKALNQEFDAIILDIMLTQMNGFEVLQAIRAHTDTPVLILTARDSDADKIVGLEIGADEYLPKPCSPYELVARLKAILRRTQKVTSSRPVIEYNHVVVDCVTRHVTIDGRFLELTNTEFNILEILIKSPGQAFSKEELTEYALGRKFTAYDRSIDVHISNLRNKLGNNSKDEPILKTVRGFGYMFNTG